MIKQYFLKILGELWLTSYRKILILIVIIIFRINYTLLYLAYPGYISYVLSVN